MLLNFQNNSYVGTLSKLIKYWQKNFGLKNTKIEFILDQTQTSYLYDKSNIDEFLNNMHHLEKALNDKKIWSLPILFYYEENNIKKAYQFILFDGFIKGFSKEQTKQCFAANPDYEYQSSTYLLNIWQFKKFKD